MKEPKRTRRGELKAPGVIYDLDDFFAHVRALAPEQVVAVEQDLVARGYSMTVTRPDGVRGVATIRLDPEDVYEGGALMDAYRTACAAIEPAPPHGEGDVM